MKANFLDFRKNMKGILEALELNESVEVYYRGKKKGVLIPEGSEKKKVQSFLEDPAFGMWKDREDMKNPTKYIHDMRRKPKDDL